jgi:hypothetical protein
MKVGISGILVPRRRVSRLRLISIPDSRSRRPERTLGSYMIDPRPDRYLLSDHIFRDIAQIREFLFLCGSVSGAHGSGGGTYGLPLTIASAVGIHSVP